MKLTSFTDFSLRVLIYLAADPARRATIAEVASAFDISENHLTKVVHFLGKEGWLVNVRGKGGGMNLAQAPEAIVIGRVVRATEGRAAARRMLRDASRPLPHPPRVPAEGRAQGGRRRLLRGARPLHPGRPGAQPPGARPHPAGRADGRHPDRGTGAARRAAARLRAVAARLSAVLPARQRLLGAVDRAVGGAVLGLARPCLSARAALACARDAVRLRARRRSSAFSSPPGATGRTGRRRAACRSPPWRRSGSPPACWC